MKNISVFCMVFSVFVVQAAQYGAIGNSYNADDHDFISDFALFAGTSLGTVSLEQRLQNVERQVDQLVRDVSNTWFKVEYVEQMADNSADTVNSLIDSVTLYQKTTEQTIKILEDRIKALEDDNQSVQKMVVSGLLKDSVFWNLVEEIIARRFCELYGARNNSLARHSSPLSSPDSNGHRLPPKLFNTPPPISLGQSSLSDSD